MNAARHRQRRLTARRLAARWERRLTRCTSATITHTPRPARNGAGVLLRHTDADGTWVLLGRRCPRLGGTWSNLGGSLDPGEAPLTGALRELAEEMLIPAADLIGSTITDVVTTTKTDGGTYTLFVIDVAAEPALPAYRDLPWEHTDAAWWFAEDLTDGGITLHHGFAACWAQLTARPTLTLVET